VDVVWNPLALPLSALRLPAALVAETVRALDLLEQAVAQTVALNEGADDARRLLAAGLERMDAMNERADLVLEELAAAREVFAEAMLKVDRLNDQGARVLDKLDDADAIADRLSAGADRLVASAAAASEQLSESQELLREANERVGRALEMAEPLDRMTTRAARIAGTLRRDSNG
jgi:methyl-accepting chemotaxis protein